LRSSSLPLLISTWHVRHSPIRWVIAAFTVPSYIHTAASLPQTSRYISGDSMSSLLWFWHADNILLPNQARWWII
jgi:hypothetical protein